VASRLSDIRTMLTFYAVETARPTDAGKRTTQPYCCSDAGWRNLQTETCLPHCK